MYIYIYFDYIILNVYFYTTNNRRLKENYKIAKGDFPQLSLQCTHCPIFIWEYTIYARMYNCSDCNFVNSNCHHLGNEIMEQKTWTASTFTLTACTMYS